MVLAVKGLTEIYHCCQDGCGGSIFLVRKNEMGLGHPQFQALEFCLWGSQIPSSIAEAILQIEKYYSTNHTGEQKVPLQILL